MPEWKEIKGFPGYRVNEVGLVYSDRSRRVLVGTVNGEGYRCINLQKKNKSYQKLLHRILAEAFLPNPDTKRTINHKDGDKLNNTLWNIEWATDLENYNHARGLGLIPLGQDHGRSKLKQLDVLKIRKLSRGLSSREIAKIYGVCKTTINNILTRKTWNHI